MQLRIYKRGSEIAETVSEKIITLVKSKPDAILGLATGSTPIETYKRVIEKAKAENVDFSKVKSFNLDEYVNCSDVAQTYRYFMDTNLFDHINIDKANTHFPDCNNPEKYDKEIALAGGVDLQILGIGANGHIGFNEPNTPFEALTHIVNLTERTVRDNARFFKSIKDVPTQAVTMGPATILSSKEIVLIAKGANKAEAIYKTFAGIKDLTCPATVLYGHNNVTVYCDEPAAEMLKLYVQN